jgi:hypothetical protein
MRHITLSIKEQAELIGRLFIDEKLINVEQLSCVKNEIEVPSYNYNADKDNAWTFYNHVTMALKKSHPRNWLSDQQKFHEFMTTSVLSKMGLQTSDINRTDSVLIDTSESDTGEETSDKVEDAIDATKDGQPYAPEMEEDNFKELQFDDDTDEVIIDEEDDLSF